MNVGIVCEFNPFHNGHAYLLKNAKELCGGNVICAMSGNFVQRGEYASADKKTRAKWAVENGADIVLENPFPFSCATAEKFALGAVKILVASSLCDALAFGCEDNVSENELYSVAEVILSDSFIKAVKKRISEDKSISFAKAREEEIKTLLGEKAAALIATPNSLLAVEYAKACLTLKKRPALYPILRKGSMHDGEPSGIYASASSIRQDISLSELYCPENVSEVLMRDGITVCNSENFYRALCPYILFGDEKDIKKTAELPHEYVHKLKEAVYECDTFESFFESLRAKHITDAKLRRMLIYLLTRTEKEELSSLPESAMLLAVSESGAKQIRQYKKNGGELAILSRLSDIKKLGGKERARYEKQTVCEKMFERLK